MKAFFTTLRYTLIATLFCLGIMSCKLIKEINDRKTERRTEIRPTQSSEQNCLRLRSGEPFESQVEEVPFTGVGKITVTSDPTITCTATVIAANAVLTAQSCLVDENHELRKTQNYQFKLEVEDQNRKIVKLILWEEDPYRDVALAITQNHFDETIPFANILQTKLAVSEDSQLPVLGYGGYTDGHDINSYQTNKLRIGKLNYSGYTNDDFFGASVDYLFMEPSAEKQQITCEDDHGGPIFWPTQHRLFLAGIASITKSLDMEDEKTRCHTANEALFVPTYAILPWIREQLDSQNIAFPSSSHSSLVVANVAKLEPHDGYDRIHLKEVKFVDNPLELAAEDLAFDVCYADCSPTQIIAHLKPDAPQQVLVRLVKEKKRLIAQAIRPLTAKRRYETTFIGRLSKNVEEISELGRKEKRMILDGIQPDSEFSPPVANYKTLVRACIAGCSSPNIFKGELDYKPNDIVAIKAEVIEHIGIFLKEAKKIANQDNERSAVEDPPCLFQEPQQGS